MTIWQPTLPASGGPKYLAIAQIIADDIAAGELVSGARMPTHRDLAYRLGVTVGTVSRAYAEVARRGLTSGEVGRGTFVRGGHPTPSSYEIRRTTRTDIIDMSMNRMTTGLAGEYMAKTLIQLANSSGLSVLTEYQPALGMPEHRQSGTKLLAMVGLDVPAEAIIMTNGGQHAIAASLMALVNPGDTVLTENLTWWAVKALARTMNFRLKGLEMDDEGLLPDAFEQACKVGSPKALYTMPTLHNPCNSTQSDQRRRDIAAIAEHYGVAVIEDDVYGFLPSERPPPLSAYAPEQGFYLTSTAKSFAPGLRVGYIAAPARMTEKIGRAVQLTGWMIPPLMGEIASRWIDDGTAAKLIDWHRENARFRMALAKNVLQGFDIVSHPQSYHLWLRLPADMPAADLIRASAQRGIAVSPPESFALDNVEAPNAVRVCLGAPETMRQLENGLHILRDIIEGPPQPDMSLL
ncbi:MAG: PLP-dependent aminotransferase family protein [Rhodospirillaceae bacterium]|nr:PLP-dependent aminotransferase family protein [Rhodospirillaceae bacterium]